MEGRIALDFSVHFLSSVFVDKETGKSYRQGFVIDDRTGRQLQLNGNITDSHRVCEICLELAELGFVPTICDAGYVEVRM